MAWVWWLLLTIDHAAGLAARMLISATSLTGEDSAMEDIVRPRMPEVEAPRIQRRQPPAAPAAAAEPQGYDFGSPEANAAAKKLESMGAIVHPPGSSKVPLFATHQLLWAFSSRRGCCIIYRDNSRPALQQTQSYPQPRSPWKASTNKRRVDLSGDHPLYV